MTAGALLDQQGGRDAEPRLVKRFHAVPSAPLDVVVWGCSQHAFVVRHPTAACHDSRASSMLDGSRPTTTRGLTFA